MQQSVFEARFSARQDAIFDRYGVEAVFTTDSDDITATILLDDYERNTQDKPGSRSSVLSLRGSVRVSEVAVLTKGDRITLSGETTSFRIVPNSLKRDGLVWHFEAIADITTTLGDVKTFPNQ